MISEQTKSAIVHLAECLRIDAVCDNTIVTFGEGIAVVKCESEHHAVEISGHNPISAAMRNILEEVCTDCLKLDYYFADPYFVALVKGYLEVLINTYGKEVPITKTIAELCLTHDLTPHSICYRGKNGDLYQVGSLEHDNFKIATTSWLLVVK